MGFIYPRTISVSRQSAPPVATVGTVPFGGDQPVNETQILSGLPASIQLDRLGTADPSNLPSSSKLPMYRIFIPRQYASLGQINKNDMVTDDIGQRYHVVANYWTSLGYQLMTQMMAM